MRSKAKKIINFLNLKPLIPEGGYYIETFRGKEKTIIEGKERQLLTAIYYFLKKGEVCKIHRLKSDEIWHFYLGDPVNIFLIHPDGKFEKKVLGNRIEKGEFPQVVIPQMVWQGAKLKKSGKYALMGTTVSPAFDFKDFEIAQKKNLEKEFPHLKKIIDKFF